jgi:hypothetical protein
LLGPDFLELRIFDIDRLAQRPPYTRAVPIDFAQACIAPSFRAHNHAINALNFIEFMRQHFRHDSIHGQIGGSERSVDLLDRLGLAPRPGAAESVRSSPAEQSYEDLLKPVMGLRADQLGL